jgi:hypothetical protein
MVARKYAEAVALVVCVNKDGSGWTATAWAFGSDLFASNGHVSQPAEQALGSGGEVYIYLNRGKGERLRVTAARTHPKYSEKTPLAAIYDVGVLEVAGKVKNYFPIAKENALRAVDSGTRVAFLGFPSGGLALNNFNLNSPIATMQSGIITAVSDYELGDSGYAGNILFRHNLASTTGASGSPVFDTQGAVVGILNAGSTITQVKRTRNRATGKEELTFEAAPSGVLINYAQRVDLLWDIVSRPK